LDPTTPDEAIQLLADPRGSISRHWLIILDNVDDAEIPLGDFFPPCDFGAILITTRNITLGNLSPNGVISLEVMSTEEAIELLLRTALGPSSRHTNRDREFAAEIVEMLGYLPMAIVQAGCYIKLQQCLPDYANRLRVNRGRLLRKPALAQLDKLKYDHSVYAAFDTTLSVLSPLALKSLGILSFVHFTDFPYPLFGIAASYGFDYDPIYLFNRPEEYYQSVDLLKGAFCPNGAWDDEILERVLEELQQYSMLTLVPINSIVTLRLHPLVHSWAKDRLSAQEAVIFRAAAVQLLVCGTHFDNAYLWEYLFPHLKYFPPTSNELHLNDRAALAYIVRQLGTTTELVKIWENIHDQVRSSLGEGHLQTSRATLQLADAYGENNELEKMEQLEREVVGLRSSLLGAQHPETLLAMGNLARTLKSINKYTEASQLEMFVISNSRTAAKPDPRGLASALNELALTRRAQKQYAEAIVLLEESVDITKALLGEAHTATIYTMELLSSCYALAGEQDHARDLRTQMEGLKRQINGPRYTVLLRHMDSLAYACFKEEKYAEAESQWKEVLAGHRETSGNMHKRTLNIMFWLSSAIHRQGKHAEADELAGKVVEGRRLVYGETHAQTLDALHLQAKFLHVQGRYTESEKIWREELVGRRKVDKTNSNSTLNALVYLSDALFEQTKYQEAETLRRELYEGCRETAGEHHVTTLKALLQLARAIFKQERYTESAKLFQKVMEGRRKVHGNSHAGTLGPIHWVGRSLYAQSNFSEAEKVWKDELAGRREVYGNRHLTTANVLGWLSNALFEQKQYAEAEMLRREEWECRREMQGELDADTLSALAGLAHVILIQARHAEGHALLRDLVEKQKAAHGDDHPETQRAIQWLHEATTSAEQEKVVDDAGTYHAPMRTLTISLPLASIPQPQRSFAWFQRFQQSGNIRESLTSPASPINKYVSSMTCFRMQSSDSQQSLGCRSMMSNCRFNSC
jgi:tetratricopeptide (TPR) repeat protein